MGLHNANAHTCHADGCDTAVHPKQGFCEEHWMMLPGSLKKTLWDAFTPMQEYRKKYSRVYLQALRDGRNFLMMRETLDRHSLHDVGRECLYCRKEVLAKRCEICLREPDNPFEKGLGEEDGTQSE